MKIALAQTNSTIGDVTGNTAKIVEGIAAARTAGADLVLFPELAILGYPPKDLLRRASLIDENVRAIHAVAEHCRGITAIVGYVQPSASGSGKGMFNSAAVCADGAVVQTYNKALLPTYDVFDDSRYFSPGQETVTFTLKCGGDGGAGESACVGVTICEDLWNDHQFGGRRVYGIDPVAAAVGAGAELIVNIGASPFVVGKQAQRERLFCGQASEHGVAIVSVNAVGGQDDLIYDGASFAADHTGRLIARAKAFSEDLIVVDVAGSTGANAHETPGAVVQPYPDRVAGIHQALVLGIRDYMRRCGFGEAVIGLSGGIDSAVTAALAVEAVGAKNVHGVAMPSRFSSEHSVQDARALADGLGIDFVVTPIEKVHRSMEQALQPSFERARATTPGVAEENVQARIRGAIVMAMSNKFGWLLLSTGNKSELAVGYCTLYGDMCGGLAVLSDVPKTNVYDLAKHINEQSGESQGSQGIVIPRRTIDKPPSAELRADQQDTDSLPPYDILDAILQRYVEADESADAIVDAGFDRKVVERVMSMVDRNEYKRAQAPIGLKVTTRAFGSGRRMPIAAKYR